MYHGKQNTFTTSLNFFMKKVLLIQKEGNIQQTPFPY